MFRSVFAVLVLVGTILCGMAAAQQVDQEPVWVQIEALPSLTRAQERAVDYSAQLEDVNGFALGGSWYGILLGPYLPEDAQQVLRSLRADRLIPRDSFIAYSRNLRAQFWPEGANLLGGAVVSAPVPQPQPQAEPEEAPVVELAPSDETPAEARRGERLLNGQERRDLQIALRAAGFYNSTIDGSFGAGTRRSMSDWQFSNGFEPTGILTTAQRKALMDQYNEPLISVGMDLTSDGEAGIQMQMPAGAVTFARYEPPFAHYDASSELPARVLLISQKGDQATLHGLYDIMQTLEIVPVEGPRARNRNSFTLEGRNEEIVSYTEASLQNGEIKGFTLIWPTGDEARRLRVLEEMKTSFARTDGALEATAGDNTIQDIDLVSGLEIRKPRLSRSGFFVDASGAVITTSDAVENCTRVTIDEEYEAEVLINDPTRGIAVLKPSTALSPIAVAGFREGKGRLQSEIAVSGYSYGGALGAPTLTFGTIADVKGLNGQASQSRLVLTALPGDAGGPVIDAMGGVLGMLLTEGTDESKQLPDSVSIVADADEIRAELEKAGIKTVTNTQQADISPRSLSETASGMTVLIGCWG